MSGSNFVGGFRIDKIGREEEEERFVREDFGWGDFSRVRGETVGDDGEFMICFCGFIERLFV